jgi:hypothetical protein
MRPYRLTERKEAIRRGMEFIYRVARRREHFAEYGSDLISCFHYVSLTSKDASLRRMVREMGRERALRWRRDNSRLAPDADADDLIYLIHGAPSATGLGFPDEALDRQIKEAVGRFTAGDFLRFDPMREAPPTDVPDQCECGCWNERGRKRCSECRGGLTMMTRYGVWYDALINAYAAERFGVALGGARYADVLGWLPTLRPYRGGWDDSNPEFYDTVYAITHIVYTLNDYSLYRLSPRWLPQEFAFLKANLKEAVTSKDPETVGEFLDALRAFGLEDTHPLIRGGIDYLLSCQNRDGSWGDVGAEGVYRRYHPTWTAIDGLREYRWRGRRLSFPELLPVLRAWENKRPLHARRGYSREDDGHAAGERPKVSL